MQSLDTMYVCSCERGRVCARCAVYIFLASCFYYLFLFSNRGGLIWSLSFLFSSFSVRRVSVAARVDVWDFQIMSRFFVGSILFSLLYDQLFLCHS